METDACTHQVGSLVLRRLYKIKRSNKAAHFHISVFSPCIQTHRPSMKLSLLSLALVSSAAVTAAADVPTYSTTVLMDRATLRCTLIAPTAETQRHRAITTPSDVVELTKLRQNRHPDELLANVPVGMQQFVTVLGGSANAVATRVAERCPQGMRPNQDADTTRSSNARRLGTTATDVRKIVDSGDPANRIDVVFMGDGYTMSENARFFDDMKRLTNDMFTGDTFAQYLPLFNIWAAFVPSNESGVGVNSTPRDTAFQLYRDGNELRGLYSANEQAARDVCDAMGTGACDFPSLIGNDDFYGGLGGEFVISTRSATSGTIVLRHEMGHNFGVVGEEYDGGYVYRGANSAPSVDVAWTHWLTKPTKRVEEKGVQLYQKHIWLDLEKGGPYAINFTSTGNYTRWFVQFSVSGTDTDDSLSVTLDGQPLVWKSTGLKDRKFYEYTNRTHGFSAGAHQLVFKAGGIFGVSPIVKQLCSAAIYEYADESEFQLDDPLAIAIYPTFDINKRKTYRPDNEQCLMRNMMSTHFCKVCQENMWLQFLARIEFIDAVQISGRSVSLQLIPLGQFRLRSDTFVQADPAVALAEKYSVQWLKSDGQELIEFRDVFAVDFTSQPAGTYTARVTFSTPNVRKDPSNYMVSEKTFTLA